ncbi:TPA: hypothetical protein U1C24_000943 [Streptococcus suis]|nr:hypothetical protein [Streptococcus suis]HEM3630369.1 hypothetical protein [Streptococcus suis]HEM3643844.1 hypothetical protein [Streptococcus suis]
MELIDEVHQLSYKSHAKWFERFFREHDLVQKIKTSAQKGYSGYRIEVFSVKDEYIRRRLEDERTLKELRKVLGAGFNVEYEVSYSKNIFTGAKYVTSKKIHITW